MKTCSKCGVELKDDSAYCNKCGAMHRMAVEDLGEKKKRVLTREGRGLKPLAVVAAAAFFVIAVAAMYRLYIYESPGASEAVHPDGAAASYHEPVAAERGIVRLSLNDLLDDKARFYVYSFSGREIRFFLLRAPDGTIRAALDACNACYRAKLGYRQEGESVVCNNCGMSFRPVDIGVVTGGCNPIPIEKTLDSQAVLIKAKDIEEGARYF